MPVTSLEVISIPDIVRKIRIYAYGDITSVVEVSWAGSKQTFTVEHGEHQPFIIEHGSLDNNILTVQCLSGSVNFGSIDINYSWKLNPIFTEKYSNQVPLLIESGFDLSLITEDFLQALYYDDLFISTGENDFSAVTNLVNNASINGIEQDANSWFKLSQGDKFSCNVYLTTPSIDSAPKYAIPESVTRPTVANRAKDSVSPDCNDITWVSKCDKNFINQIDTRFYEFVNKKLADHNVKWGDHLFTDYKVPYGHAIRIQSQLVDNTELIRDKHVVDLGHLRGQFLYPCIELGCKSITGIQPMAGYNDVINEALINMGHGDKAKAVWGDAYDLQDLAKQLQGKDTILMLGLLYHLNNHYQLLETVTRSDITGMVIDIAVLDYELEHYVAKDPRMMWRMEQQNVDEKGWEFNGVNKDWTWVGHPNAAWLVQTLTYMGWKIKSDVMLRIARTKKPQLIHRGVVTAYR